MSFSCGYVSLATLDSWQILKPGHLHMLCHLPRMLFPWWFFLIIQGSLFWHLTPILHHYPALFLNRTVCNLVNVLFAMSACLIFIGTYSLVREHEQVMSILYSTVFYCIHSTVAQCLACNWCSLNIHWWKDRAKKHAFRSQKMGMSVSKGAWWKSFIQGLVKI